MAPSLSSSILVLSTALLSLPLSVLSLPTSYANAFVSPKWILNKSGWNPGSTAAQQAIVQGASDYALLGPWAVTNKTILPPSHNIHDYLSYAPYYWPDCSNVHNTTALTQQQINDECTFVFRDGQFVPDQHSVNNSADIYNLGDAVFYASMAWVISGDSVHAANINHWIDTWFVNNNTIMTPNLQYAQLVRGVGENVGVHTGLLDFKGFAKIATGVLTLRLGGAPEWTQEVDNGFKQWLTAYLPWVTNSTEAIQEAETPNNHGSFYVNQLAAIYLILDDQVNARRVLQNYFDGIFQDQIIASGEQPLEADRADPIHYRAYNLAAVITNAALADYIGYDAWNTTTKTGGTIQKAADYAIVQNPLPSNETDAVSQNYQIVACVASIYGDPTGKYKQYLSSVQPSEAFFFWNFDATINSTTTTVTSSGTGGRPTATLKPSSASSLLFGANSVLVWMSTAIVLSFGGLLALY